MNDVNNKNDTADIEAQAAAAGSTDSAPGGVPDDKPRGVHRKHRKHRVLRALLIVFLIIVLIIVCLGIWQRENISAVLHGLQTDTEEIEQEIEAADQEMDEAVSDYAIPDTHVSDEVAEGIVEGTIDVNNVVEELLEKQKTTSASDSSSASGSGNAYVSSDAELQRLITKLYVLRGSYISRLDSLISSAKSEYAALPEAQRTDSARRSIISSKISQGSALESACDSQVSSIVSQIRSRLSETGQSTALADQIMSAYQREKQLKKSYYMSLV